MKCVQKRSAPVKRLPIWPAMLHIWIMENTQKTKLIFLRTFWASHVPYFPNHCPSLHSLEPIANSIQWPWYQCCKLHLQNLSYQLHYAATYSDNQFLCLGTASSNTEGVADFLVASYYIDDWYQVGTTNLSESDVSISSVLLTLK